jgi:hypothetical protein
VTRDDVAAVVIQALLSNKADGKVREVEQKCDVMYDVWLCTCVTLGLGGWYLVEWLLWYMHSPEQNVH